MGEVETFLDKVLHVIERFVAPIVMAIMIAVGAYYIFDTIKTIYQHVYEHHIGVR